mgnify:CR=1 FL=1
MSWDPIWEGVFRSREWGRYPPEELIRFIARHFYSVSDRGQVKILEVGCGAGANLWYLAREGFDAYGIDGSQTAIVKAERRMQEEGVKAHLQVGDIIRLGEVYPTGFFDAVIDVACLEHNRMNAIQVILDQVLLVLKPGGRFFSMMAAVDTYGAELGKEVEPGTFIDIAEGPVSGIGLCHFFTLEEVQRTFGRFNDVQVECSNSSLNSRQQWFKLWVVEGVKGEVARS